MRDKTRNRMLGKFFAELRSLINAFLEQLIKEVKRG